MCPRVHRLSQRYWDAELCITEKPAPNVLCHSVLLSKNSRYFCPQSVVLKERCIPKYFVDLVIE